MSTDASKATQCDAIRAALERGETLTPMDALQRYGCFRLGARIWDLKRAGMRIETLRVEANGKSFAGYKLDTRAPDGDAS